MSQAQAAAIDVTDPAETVFWPGVVIGAGMALLASVSLGYLFGPPLPF